MLDPWLETTIGLIMMIVLGPAVGNYATSVVYRLPFGQTPFEKNPYCGDCGTMLAPKDLFPILSYLSTGGKCRYCGVKIRPSYTWVEVACGLIFCVNYLFFGVSEDFILVTTIGVFLVILAGLEYHENKLFVLILTYLFALGAIHRVLHESTIYGFFYSAFAMMFLSICWWRAHIAIKGEVSPIPDYIWLAVLIGIMLPLPLLPAATMLTLVIWMGLSVLLKLRVQSMSVGIAIYLCQLYPECFAVSNLMRLFNGY